MSIANYRLAIRNFLACPFLPDDLAQLTPMHVEAWSSQLRKSGKSPATRNWYQQHVRTFLRWLHKKARVTSVNLAEELEPVEVKERYRPQATQDDVDRLLQVAANRVTVKGNPSEHYYRDIAIIRLLWATGIRRAELVRLTIDQVDLEERELRLAGAGTKTRVGRVVPFDTATKHALRQYIIRERGNLEGALFLQRDGEPITTTTVQTMFRRMSAKAGVHVRPHAFRRGLARRTRDAGFDLGETAALLGHRSLEMTRIYSGKGEEEAMMDAYRKKFG